MDDSTNRKTKQLSIISSTFRRKHKRKTQLSNAARKSNKREDNKLVKNTDQMKKNGDDEKEEVERKIRALQRIVPGGESLGVDMLFEETAGYIMALQSQLKAMKALANFFQGLDDQNRKFGA